MSLAQPEVSLQAFDAFSIAPHSSGVNADKSRTVEKAHDAPDMNGSCGMKPNSEVS
jgi:hypothetical protein